MVLYTKRALQEMEPWTTDVDMIGVSISSKDMEGGSPKQGDMIAFNPEDRRDRWLVAHRFFINNYDPYMK
jgi:hypothetical protein